MDAQGQRVVTVEEGLEEESVRIPVVVRKNKLRFADEAHPAPIAIAGNALEQILLAHICESPLECSRPNEMLSTCWLDGCSGLRCFAGMSRDHANHRPIGGGKLDQPIECRGNRVAEPTMKFQYGFDGRPERARFIIEALA